MIFKTFPLLLIGAIFLTPPLLSTARASESQEALAVMPVELIGIPEEFKESIGEVLAAELTAQHQFRVVTASDVQAILNFESSKQALGCEDDVCFAEIGGALGARYILSSQFTKMDSAYLINLKLIDAKESKTIRRVYQRISGTMGDMLDTLRLAVAIIVDPASGEGVVKIGIQVSKLTWGFAGTSLIAAVVGAGFGYQANTAYDHATDPSYAGGQHEVADGESAQTNANIAFALAGGAAIGAAISFVLGDTDWFEPPPPIPMNGSKASVGLGFRF